MPNKPELSANDPKFVEKLDDQIERLRRMLVLMAPETGATALGAARTANAKASPAFDAPAALTE